MTVDTSKIKGRMRARADQAARRRAEAFDRGDTTAANYQAGVEAAMRDAAKMVGSAETEAYAERDAAVSS
jgi:hypothetical protein